MFNSRRKGETRFVLNTALRTRDVAIIPWLVITHSLSTAAISLENSGVPTPVAGSHPVVALKPYLEPKENKIFKGEKSCVSEV